MPPSEPVITCEPGGYRVSVERNGRACVYTCDTEAEAKRFAALLATPPVEPPRRRVTPAPHRASVAGSGVCESVAFVKPPPRWRSF